MEEVFLAEELLQTHCLKICFVIWGQRRMNNIMGRFGKWKVGMTEIEDYKEFYVSDESSSDMTDHEI